MYGEKLSVAGFFGSIPDIVSDDGDHQYTIDKAKAYAEYPDTRAVALQRIGTDSTPVVQILQNFETLEDDLVRSVALYMCDETDTTGVMFVGGVVKTLLQGKIHLVFPRHNTHRHSHSCSTGPSNCGKPPRPNRQKKPAHRSAGYSDPDEETVQTHWARVEYTAAGAGFSRFFCSAATGGTACAARAGGARGGQ